MASKGNIYGWSREATWKPYENRLKGSPKALALAIFSENPGPTSQNAVEKSFLARGYQADDVCFAHVAGMQANELFELIEGLDPLCLVAMDAEAIRLCETAYKRPFPPERETRLFGREARGFECLDSLVESDEGKQKAWRLLKTLPEN